MKTLFDGNQALWAAVAVTVTGFGLLSMFASAQRLNEWADERGFIIVKKSRFGPSRPDEFQDLFRRKQSGRFYVEVEDREKNRFGAWIDVGGIFAAITGRKPEVVWDNRPAYLKK